MRGKVWRLVRVAPKMLPSNRDLDEASKFFSACGTYRSICAANNRACCCDRSDLVLGGIRAVEQLSDRSLIEMLQRASQPVDRHLVGSWVVLETVVLNSKAAHSGVLPSLDE